MFPQVCDKNVFANIAMTEYWVYTGIIGKFSYHEQLCVIAVFKSHCLFRFLNAAFFFPKCVLSKLY